MRALRRVWEGQPDLELPALLGVIANRGIGWGSTDEELLRVLSEIEEEHPSLIDASSDASHLMATAAPPHSVTLSAGTAVVRSGDDPKRMPGVWDYSTMRRAGPGLPLVIGDADGVEHRLGVITLVTSFDPGLAPPLTGLSRGGVGSCRWLVTLPEGRRCVVGQRIRLWDPSRRSVGYTTLAWERILACEAGEEMVVLPAGGRPAERLGTVAAVHVLEV